MSQYLFGAGVLLGAGMYFYNKKSSKPKQPTIPIYSVSVHETYDNTRFGKVYQYDIENPRFDEFETKYKFDLMRNDVQKKSIDLVLQDYMQNNKIKEKHVVIHKSAYTADFEINSSTQTDHLVIYIYE